MERRLEKEGSREKAGSRESAEHAERSRRNVMGKKSAASKRATYCFEARRTAYLRECPISWASEDDRGEVEWGEITIHRPTRPGKRRRVLIYTALKPKRRGKQDSLLSPVTCCGWNQQEHSQGGTLQWGRKTKQEIWKSPRPKSAVSSRRKKKIPLGT